MPMRAGARPRLLPSCAMTTSAHERSRALFFEGVDHFEAGRLEPARTCFERCLALTPDRPSVLGNLGVTWWRLGKPREALPLLLQATAADPTMRDAWAALGLAHEALGDFDAAARALRQALALQDDVPALWFSLGECLGRLGRAAEALQAFDRATQLDPAFTQAWSVRGSLLRETGRLDEAARSFERALALGADPELHAYYLASVRGGPAPARPPRRYVEALFDDYAAEFQQHVVERLGYRAFERLLRPIVESGRRFAAALDLGCGTGLCGPLLRRCCDTVDGVDLSARMLEQAARLGVYRELIHADLLDFLTTTERRADLVVAADVLIYVGDLAAVLHAVARVLQPSGVFAFTVELPTAGHELQLQPSLRYAHSEPSVRRLAQASGLPVERIEPLTLRHDQGRAVEGLCVQLRRAADDTFPRGPNR
jgi:predicted TPR repeat methyltransferase